MDAVESLLSQPVVQQIGWVLVHFLWQGVAIALLLACGLYVMRRSGPQARWLASSVALVAMLAAPLATMGVLATVGQSVQPAAVTGGDGGDSVVPGGTPSVAPFQVSRGAVEPPPGESSPWLQRAQALLRPALPWASAAWALGVLTMGLWHLGGWLQTQRLKRSRTVAVSQAVRDAVARIRRQLKVSRPVRVLESALAQVPMVIGWLRPVILLPSATLAGLTTEQLEAIVAHELAHVRRCDGLVRLLQAVAETLLFYHPAVWWVSRCIRTESEYCCDDLAATVCGDRHRYVRAMAALVELQSGSPYLAPAATGGRMLPRMWRLLGIKPGREAARGWLAIPLLIALAVGVAVAVTLSGGCGGTSRSDHLKAIQEDALKTADLVLVVQFPDKDSPVEIPVNVNDPVPGLLACSESINGSGRISSDATAEHPVELAHIVAAMGPYDAMPGLSTRLQAVEPGGSAKVVITINSKIRPMYLMQAGPKQFGWMGDTTSPFMPLERSYASVGDALAYYFSMVNTSYRLKHAVFHDDEPRVQTAALEKQLEKDELVLAEEWAKRLRANGRPGAAVRPGLTVESVTFDAAQKVWVARVRMWNNTATAHKIATDGDASRLPQVVVPTAYVEIDELQPDRQWKNITPYMDGLGVEYSLEPGQTVWFEARLSRRDAQDVPGGFAPGSVLRLRCGGVTSGRFVVRETAGSILDKDLGADNPKERSSEVLLEQFADCLGEFLNEHAGKGEFVSLGVKPSSLAGIRKEEKPGLFFVGQWTVQHMDQGYHAIWSRAIAENEEYRLVVDMTTAADACRIEKWSIQEVQRIRE